ncbi:MAG: thioredoxin domain-containing protein [Candidatus Omnitrophota bacterium]|nr:thioredoxin domain-containing protein [Candidatus Omnitrophota bacterium]
MSESSPNLLAREKSPYLLQHATNPVDWFPWGEEAFAKAREENKPIFLSIGYSTCHWCHVMEDESFTNQEVADLLNEGFVAVKVDREERPDVDGIYMKAVMAMSGSGGWPMSVFLTPDRRPFYGGTYFPPEDRWGRPGFKSLLKTIRAQWSSNRQKLVDAGDHLTEQLGAALGMPDSDREVTLTKESLDEAYGQFLSRYDAENGGFGNAPKFPSSHVLSFLLQYWHRANQPRALEMAVQTLRAMAKGGMYDHLGGGFHRYSTDERWHIPHFEKMLYDQAILTKTYVEAYQATHREVFAEVAKDTFAYVLRDMTSPEGAFYSAEDADSLEPAGGGKQKKEGAFYVWTEAEIREHLGQAAELFIWYYGVEPGGNAQEDVHGEFTGKNILFAAKRIAETAQKFKKTAAEVRSELAAARLKLLESRGKRPRPHLDDKVLADWNALMISSFCLASRVLGEPAYRIAAAKAGDFILSKMVDAKGRLLHRYRDGHVMIPGFLDDYAFLTQALLDLYEATFEIRYLGEAKRFCEEMLRLFWDENAGGFFFVASDGEQLISRSKEFYDGAIPSGNSVAAQVLVRMARLTGDAVMNQKVDECLAAFASQISRFPSGHPQALMALDFSLGPSYEIVIAEGTNRELVDAMVKTLFNIYLPNRVLLFRPVSAEACRELEALVPFAVKQIPVEGETTAYVCKGFQCDAPVQNVSDFRQKLSGD